MESEKVVELNDDHHNNDLNIDIRYVEPLDQVRFMHEQNYQSYFGSISDCWGGVGIDIALIRNIPIN